MGKQYKELTDNDITFIKDQKLFYIASCSNHEVNLSPRGYESLYIKDHSTLYMIDYLGSGNRTARDIYENGEITLTFNAFDGAPKILRCFCKGKVVTNKEKEFSTLMQHFDESGDLIRQVFIFTVYAVESSCGMGVPIMEYKEPRNGVKEYALKMHESGKFDDYIDKHRIPPNLTSEIL